MTAKPIKIDWHPDLSIFARESFLKSVGDDYGWLGGIDESENLRCILPYTVIRKAFLNLIRFRVETIPFDPNFSINEERAFLNSVVEYFKARRADVIIPATTNAIFRTYPDGAEAAPYGSYIIDLTQPEDVLWKNIDRITRQNINSAAKAGVVIEDGSNRLEEAYVLIKETFHRSKLPFMNFGSFKRFVSGLGEYGKVLVARYQDVPQSFGVFAFSNYCAYAFYAGNVENQQKGSNKLLYWEAIKLFKNLGARTFDFSGTRINPEKGSKQDALGSFKKHFGTKLKQGYMWKYPLNPLKYRFYCLATRLRTGGDIVDAEKHKLNSFSPDIIQ